VGQLLTTSRHHSGAANEAKSPTGALCPYQSPGGPKPPRTNPDPALNSRQESSTGKNKPICLRTPRFQHPFARVALLHEFALQKYGVRFFDLVVVDSWYANGPFLKTVVEELGWPVIAVLKQERYEAHQEALALTNGQKPTQVVERDGRQVEIWDVPSVRFTDSYAGPVRVVRVRERWTQRQRVGKQWQTEEKEQNWIWVVAGDLDGYGGAAMRDLRHLRWKIENNAFGELTQHWHLTHCAHHHPVAVVALLWIKIIAFTLFHAFAILHGKLFRLGKATLQEVRKQIYRSLLCGLPVRFFSG
jgi:hypothetical protein